MNAKQVFSRIVTGFPAWILITACLFLFNFITRYNGLYGQDAYDYLRYSRSIHEFFINQNLSGHFLWPPVYPLSGSILSFLFSDIFSLQLVNLVCYGLIFHLLRKILLFQYPLFKPQINSYLILFFCLSPFIIRYSSSIMSDMLCILFITAFLYNYLLFIRNHLYRFFLKMILFAGLTVNTRYAPYLIIIFPLIHGVSIFMKIFKARIFFLALGILIITFLPDIFFKIHEHKMISVQPYLMNWSFLNFFYKSFHTSNGYFYYPVPNILYAFSNLVLPGYIFTGGIFLCLIRKEIIQSIFIKVITISIVMYSLFLAGFEGQNQRLLLLTFPCLMIIFYNPFLRISNYFNQSHRIVLLFLIILAMAIQLFLIYKAFRPFYNMSKNELYIAEKVKNRSENRIYTFSIEGALQAYGVNKTIVSLYDHELDYFTPNSLVLFNYSKFHNQWNGLTPMINWEKLVHDHHLFRLESLPEGWVLYEISD